MAPKKETQAVEVQVDAAAEAERIIAEAKAQAEQILTEAKEKAEETKADTAKDEEQLVPVFLFKDNNKYKDDVFVAINGRRWLIKRGETVMVPAYVAEVLQQSMKQDMATADLIDQKHAEYEKAKEMLN